VRTFSYLEPFLNPLISVDHFTPLSEKPGADHVGVDRCGARGRRVWTSFLRCPVRAGATPGGDLYQHGKLALVVRRADVLDNPRPAGPACADLNAKIRAFIDGCNDRAHPFVWTKTAEHILKKANQQTTSDAAH